jgi:hypothetical protein
MSKQTWWGYLHINGTIQAKRYFDSRDTAEAEESVFCGKVVYPFEAENREKAIEHIKSQVI